MLRDDLLLLANSQDISSTTEGFTTDWVKLGVERDIAQGNPLFMQVYVNQSIVMGGTDTVTFGVWMSIGSTPGLFDSIVGQSGPISEQLLLNANGEGALFTVGIAPKAIEQDVLSVFGGGTLTPGDLFIRGNYKGSAAISAGRITAWITDKPVQANCRTKSAGGVVVAGPYVRQYRAGFSII